MTSHETVFLAVAPLIKSIQINGDIATLYAHHDIDPTNRRNNSVSLLKNLNTIRTQLHNIILSDSSVNSGTLQFKYEGPNKVILDALIRSKKRFDAIKVLRENGGIALSVAEVFCTVTRGR